MTGTTTPTEMVDEFMSPRTDFKSKKRVQEGNSQIPRLQRQSHDSDASCTRVLSEQPSDSGLPCQLQEHRPRTGMSPTNMKFEMSAQISQPATMLKAMLGPWEEYALGRRQFMELSDEWMASMEKYHSATPGQLDGEAEYGRLQRVWLQLRSFASQLEELEAVLPPRSRPLVGELEVPTPAMPRETSYPATIVDELHETFTSSKDPDYADLFYHHVSAVRWCSDDLINLGPRPTEHLGSCSHSDDSREMTDYISYQEYAERHLEILKDLAYHREQATIYKTLCIEKGIALEDDVGDMTDAQSNDIYQSLVDEKEAAASRIDSLVALQQSEPVLRTTSSPLRIESTPNARIAEWATTLSGSYDAPPGPQPIVEPLDRSLPAYRQSTGPMAFLDVSYNGRHRENDHTRLHRRRSKSAEHPPTPAICTKQTRPRATSAGLAVRVVKVNPIHDLSYSNQLIGFGTVS